MTNFNNFSIILEKRCYYHDTINCDSDITTIVQREYSYKDIHVHVYIHRHTHTQTYTDIHIYIVTCTYTGIYSTCIHIQTYMYMYSCTYTTNITELEEILIHQSS